VKVLVDGAGAVLAVGADDPGWQPPGGGRVVETARTAADYQAAADQAAGAAQPSEVAWQADAFAVRQATLSPAQAQRQTDLANLKAYAALAPGTATAAQTQAAAQAIIRLLRDLYARLQ
jgi:hypothetical protein